VEREGRIERVEHGPFEGEEAVYHLIERVVGPLGLRVDESWEARCACGTEGWLTPDAVRVRLDPLDARTSHHLPQCGFVSETDAAMLRVLLKVTDKGDYDWVECSACGAGWQVPHYGESAEDVG
jgi:hypothetical protein